MQRSPSTSDLNSEKMKDDKNITTLELDSGNNIPDISTTPKIDITRNHKSWMQESDVSMNQRDA